MLVHICCSVDSHFFLQELKKIYPNEELIGYFYDPNIHPYSEYYLRYLDVKRSCKKLGVKLIKGEYDYNGWIEAVRGLEHEPEKGKRCTVCFDNRLENTAKMAKKIGQKLITTTLLTSPKKSIQTLSESLKEVCDENGLDFVAPDFRKNGGTTKQFELAKNDMLYHQNYCGCIFALTPQREAQKRLSDELMSPLCKQILPSSIEERIKLYKRVKKYEKKGIDFWLKRESFLNYRLLRGAVKCDEQIIPSYFLFYSFMKRKFTKGRIEKIQQGIGYFNRENIILLDLNTFNHLAKSDFKNVKEMIFKGLGVKKELKVRQKLQESFYSLSPIIILDSLKETKYEITLHSQTYQDHRERIVYNKTYLY